MLAHVGGVPVEELGPAAIAVAGGGLALARAWVRAHLHRGGRIRSRTRCE